MESKKQVIYKDGRWIQLAGGSSGSSGSGGETDAIELNLNDGSWKIETNPDGTTFTKTCSAEEIASLSVNNVRLTGTVSLENLDINTSTFGVFNLMHIHEQLNAWSKKSFSYILGGFTVTIATVINQLSVSFLKDATEYNRRLLSVEFTPSKTNTEHYYQIHISGTDYSLNVSDIDSIQFRYPLDNNQELLFPVIQKPGSDAIKNIVSTVYNGHIYEIHFSKDNQLTDEGNKLIIRHMDGTVDNNAIGEITFYGHAEARGYTSFMD